MTFPGRITPAVGILLLALAGCGDRKAVDNINTSPSGTYVLTIESDQWVTPESIGNIIGTYVPDFLLQVLSSGDATVQLMGALMDDASALAQDLCAETIDFPVADLSANASFTAGPVAFPLTIAGYHVTLHNLHVSGTFTPDGTAFAAGSFTGVLDAREFEGFFGTDATGVCELVASVGAGCEACPADGVPCCLTVRAEGLTAPRVDGLTLTPITAAQIAPWCDPNVPECDVNVRVETYDAGLFNGYTLYAPLHDTTTYLIDICGDVVHTWQSEYNPGLGAYLLDNGHLLRAGQVGNQDYNPPSTGGVVEELDRDSNVVWTYTYCDSQRCLHHDLEPLPNGNMLLIAWEKKSQAEAIAAGRDPSLLAAGELWPDHIFEVEPTPPTGGNIVWEWHLWEHLIQDFDAAQANFGVVADHLELYDLNGALDSSGDPDAGADLNHINAIAYHPDLDQILLSVHHANELVIIDHSTTTAEAAGHTGGRYGRGGDLLYRWGNPRMYWAGTEADQQLFGQHDAQWIGPGLPGAGNLLIFNNGMGRPFSSVDELVPPVDASGLYPLAPGAAWAPDTLAWQYTDPTPADFLSIAMSGAQRLPNGNTLICDGQGGVFFEVTADGREVWRYRAPADVYFRATRYPPDHPAIVALLP